MSESYHTAIMQRLGLIDQMAPPPVYGTPGGFNNGGGVQDMPYKSGADNFANFLHAISGQESGGNYGAVNSSSGALGKYQIMPGNIPSWSREALGHSVSTSQFLHSPSLQEQIAQYMLHKYYNQYGAGGAAVAWYAGPGRAAEWVRSGGRGFNGSQGAYPTINEYARQILKRMGIG